MNDLTARWRLGACLSVSAALTLFAQTRPAPLTFSISYRGAEIGSEEMSIARTADGWTVASSGREGPPLDFSFSKFELRYANDWSPRALEIQGETAGKSFTGVTTFTGTTAVTNTTQSGVPPSVTQTVSPHAIVIPNDVFGAYLALAAQLADAKVGATFPIYVAPLGEATASLTAVTTKHVQKPGESLDVRQFDVTVRDRRGATAVEIWIDQHDVLARVAIPAISLMALRDDLTSVMARVENVSHPGDEGVYIPADGFTLAATVSKPAAASAAAPWPAVVLVGGMGQTDRDEMTAGVAIFGQIANALADAGFVVVRYDKRGTGQSGGRVESAALEDYAADVVSVVQWTRKRKDVDAKRVAVVGYAEGGAMALLAAARTGDIRAVGLLAAPGFTGRELTLRQQDELLAHSGDSDADKAQKRGIERRLLDAVITDKGWDALPRAMQTQSDTLWFRSWLLFDPAAAMKKVSQPVLIVSGALDRQMFPESADNLERFGLARNKSGASTRKLIVPGVNHLFVPSQTGDASPPSTTVAPEVVKGLTDWLKEFLGPR